MWFWSHFPLTLFCSSLRFAKYHFVPFRFAKYRTLVICLTSHRSIHVRMHKFSNDWSIRQNNLQDWRFFDAIKLHFFYFARSQGWLATTDRRGSYRWRVVDRNSCLKFDRLLQLWTTHQSGGILRVNCDSLVRNPTFKGCERRKVRLSIYPSAFSQWRHICSRPNLLRAFEYAMSPKNIAPKTTLGLRISYSGPGFLKPD